MIVTHQTHAPLVIVSGEAHCGKTTLVADLLQYLRRQGRQLAGILAEGHWCNGRRSGFTLIDLSDCRRTPLADRIVEPGPNRFPYVFRPEGLAAGRRALCLSRCASADLLVVDEVGSLEVHGGGWAELLGPLLNQPRLLQLWVVQSAWLEAVCRSWQLTPTRIIDASAADALIDLTTTVERLLSD
ncbi:hypothetical protein Pcar_0159 [Syntrophotalea carbinolica DSM 2380]|uniref:AAA+ ATPase domain-containing protein n=1 Tax=Syntrophotalea carbinolica (strain DSM 2380 / NBRC 103641 / GraBd1) TaxID=338963 RepID=Q3A872_SYNC1|nr:nucleoside-triphosphatase [Syntrophotalea carbinolica]ABA87420.1 hypothetical protein Pcar_0159 [Syntrophotalea carbinolica DSM 2380]